MTRHGRGGLGVAIVFVTTTLSAACARDPIFLSCICATLTLLETVEGPHTHRVEEVVVLEGSYVAPPPSVVRTVTELRVAGDFLVAELGSGTFAAPIHARVQAMPVPEPNCCGSLALAPVQPPAAERNAARIEWSDVGDSYLVIDPTVTRIDPAYPPSEDGETTILEPDAAGFTLYTWHAITPAGCIDATCSALVRVRHRFDRRGE